MTATPPPEVRRNLQFFTTSGIWHGVSRNPCVTGCRDAAAKRSRLGMVGIPLSDELKSWVGLTRSQGAYIALHCRGHELLDMRKVEELVGEPVERLEPDALSSQFGQGYGLVTPFALAAHPEVRQLFDLQVTHEYFPPDTMMTNLGHCRWAVEFDPRELVKAIPNAELADITLETRDREPVEHVIGILTGNGPESGMLLWQRINERVRKMGPSRSDGDTAFPRVLIESVPEMGLSMELAAREDAVSKVVREGVQRLCEGGATLVGLACNTTQYFSREIAVICERNGASFVSIVDETRRTLAADEVERFALLAIGAASDLKTYSDFRRLTDEFAVVRPSPYVAGRIEGVAYAIKADPDSSEAINGFRDLVKFTDADTILLALTELSVVHGNQQKRRQKQRSQKTLYDTLDILANALADRYISERIAVEEDREISE